MRLSHPDDLAKIEHMFVESMSGDAGAGYRLEYRFRHKDGMYRWFQHQFTVMLDAGGQPIARIGSISDITERKRAQEALLESKYFLQATLDALSANIALLNEQGTILFVNNAWRDFAEQNGLQSEKVSEGCNYMDVCDHANGICMEEAKPFLDGIRAVLAGETQCFLLEYPCHSPSEERWFIGRVTRLPEDGPRCVVVAHENITERKRAEQERLQLSERMQQIQRKESLARMA